MRGSLIGCVLGVTFLVYQYNARQASAADNHFFQTDIDTIDEIQTIAALVGAQSSPDIGVDEAGRFKKYQNIGRCMLREFMSYPLPLEGEPEARVFRYNSWDFSHGVVARMEPELAEVGASGGRDGGYAITIRGGDAPLVNFKVQILRADSVFFDKPAVDVNEYIGERRLVAAGRDAAVVALRALDSLSVKCKAG
jgi:hypothetical protein